MSGNGIPSGGESIAKTWTRFEFLILGAPGPASPYGPVQRLEMCKAFYSGYAAAMQNQLAIADIEDEDECVQQMEKIQQELYNFAVEPKPSNILTKFNVGDKT